MLATFIARKSEKVEEFVGFFFQTLQVGGPKILIIQNTKEYKKVWKSRFLFLQIFLAVIAIASVVLADLKLELQHRSVYGDNWPRVPGIFYVRQTDPNVNSRS